MSASERLKALDADLSIFDAGPHWVDLRGPRAGTAVNTLKNALPELIAVVQAAERISGNAKTADPAVPYVEQVTAAFSELDQLAQLLAALDAKLEQA